MATSPMETRISEKGESSQANYPEPIREFTEEERNIIKEKLTIYAGEAKKLRDRGSTSCIYRVLPRLKEINSNRSYEPNVVCIGPYYYKQRVEKFQMAEDCKRKCLGSLLVKTTDEEMQINTYMNCLQRISELEEMIRKCYSEEFEVAGIEFLEIMVVDACFIIEIIEMVEFRKIEVYSSKSDLGALAWMVPYFYRDFLLLENQIPFFVLEEIYALTHNISVEESRSKLVFAALRFFKNGMKRFDSIGYNTQMEGVPVLHLLDLVRISLIIASNATLGRKYFLLDTPFIHCISKLRLAGIKVSQAKEALNLLEVKFKRGVIEMPNIAIDDLMRCLLLNCVAFEQCHQRSSNHFSVYATFLDCLVNTKEDVEYLRERNVIDNYLGDDSEAADFINRAGKDLVLNDCQGLYLGKLFEDVEKHYQNRWKWTSASRVLTMATSTMGTRISEEGEYDQKPIRVFTQQELDFIDEQRTEYSEEAKKLEEEADRSSTSYIYRVLPRLKKINGNSLYEPKMISIGPYYYNLRNERFKMAEVCKRKCFGSLLVRDSDPNRPTDIYQSCLQKISELEVDIRKCYSEEFDVSGILFLEMMVVDACFIIKIIETFGYRPVDISESLEALAWMVPYFYGDFLLLENQIPFFVLEHIYAITHNISVEDSRSKLVFAALKFFRNGMKRSDYILRFIDRDFHQMEGDPILHLLDLVRSSLIPSNISHEEIKIFFDTTFIHCISKLRLAGIKVSQGKALSLLEVKFKRGVIEMPNIAIDDLMRYVLLNCVAFEQCHKRSEKYFTVYATFLDCLMNTKEDVEYLRERNVIDNYLTDDDSELAGFFNRAGKDLVLNAYDVFYLGELFEEVDRHYRNRWKWKWASFEREYIDKPWLLLSAVGGILLVVATSIQAVMGILTYKYKNC